MSAAATAHGTRSTGALSRMDAIALTVGAKTTVGALVVACMLAIVLGAASMLDTLQKMDDGLHTNLAQLKTANSGLHELNQTLGAVPPTDDHMRDIVPVVRDTSHEVLTSKQRMAKLNAGTAVLNTSIASIAGSTAQMRASLQRVDTGTGTLARSVNALNGPVQGSATTQRQMLGEVVRMQGATGNMNASLAYVIRTLNYITSPPGGGSFTIRVVLDKSALPPIPGVKAETDPVVAFPRNSWPIYRGS